MNYDVIIMINYNHRCKTFDPILKMGDKEYACVTSVGVEGNEDGSWDGDIYSRHNGYYSSWWYDDRYQTIPVQLVFLSLSSLTVSLVKGFIRGVPPLLRRFQTAKSSLSIVRSSPYLQIMKAKSKVNFVFGGFKLHQSKSSEYSVQSKL